MFVSFIKKQYSIQCLYVGGHSKGVKTYVEDGVRYVYTLLNTRYTTLALTIYNTFSGIISILSQHHHCIWYHFYSALRVVRHDNQAAAKKCYDSARKHELQSNDYG